MDSQSSTAEAPSHTPESVPGSDEQYAVAEGYDDPNFRDVLETVRGPVVDDNAQPPLVSRQTARRMALEVLDRRLKEQMPQLTRQARRKMIFGRDRVFDVSAMARALRGLQ